MLIFNVPLIAFVVPTAEGAETRVSVDSLLFRLGPMLTATMFLLPVVIKVFGFTPYGRKKEKILDVIWGLEQEKDMERERRVQVQGQL